ncbi:hypothetical protein [Kitasatospora sp. A2-31]|uniref:hypothetical protein n=1 Tax=Kitasatospora sp. A2-31 TaxID=2916414 RepID=UPI001EE874F0|nr:hypothetical protein [Kitasatospora sp. A2-31]MCG6493442.1 hypothetical protein [Kitasatospora sp. A2-31]
MAKASGLGWTTCSVDDSSGVAKAIKNDVTDLQFSTPRAVQDITGIDKSAMERLLLLADFSATLKGVFNAASGQAHDVFKTVPSTSVNRTLSLTVNGVSLNNEVLLTDYQLSRSSSGELTWSVPAVLADGTVPTWS